LPLILTGRMLNGRQARAKGLIHDVVPREAFDFVAEKIMQTGGAGLESRRGPWWRRTLEKTKPFRKFVLRQAEKQVQSKTHGHYPAPLMAIETLRTGVEESEEAQFAAESQAIGTLAGHAVTGELLRLFFVSEAAKKLPESIASQGVEVKSDSIRQTAVIGAGAMGNAC
jgi:3-hydroxyacyl-CoA dehydrogenase/enoyl-CoA hydratase/3-hydroxybutyryl-CoA epimerase